DETAQRALVLGDGDFLSNAFLGNVGNLDLGLNLVRWVAGEDQLLDIPAKTARDLDLQLSRIALAVIGFGFLLVLPLGFAAAGATVWWRRRRR
ncbi:MAG: ABC transporter, partial [Chromatiales bacterium]